MLININFPVLHLIFVLNLIGNSYAVTRKASKVLSSAKTPLKIVGSDDEVLHPLFEKEEVDVPNGNSKPAISRQNPLRNSKSNKKGNKKKPLSFDDNSFLKMNLDLPSIISNSAPGPSKSAGSNSRYGPSSFNIKNELVKKEHESIGNFNSPFGNELVEDVDVVLYRKNVTNAIAPGTIITSKPSTLAPGTVIATSSPNLAPRTVIVDNSRISNSKLLDDKQNIPIGFDAPTFERENKIPGNDEVFDDKTPLVPLPPRIKKVRSLDEYSIESISFDPMIPGPKIGLDTEITIDFVNNILIPFFKSGKVLDRKSSFSVKSSIISTLQLTNTNI